MLFGGASRQRALKASLSPPLCGEFFFKKMPGCSPKSICRENRK
jgi:hypothetical protein